MADRHAIQYTCAGAGISLVGNQHTEEAIDLIRKTETFVVEGWVTDNVLDMAVGYSMTDAMSNVLPSTGTRSLSYRLCGIWRRVCASIQ
ncbi:hypothetical protein HED51_19650 [Ochrobactrum grignonense]|nr:hypothetical protein [Brucella grignonensis]